MDKMFTTLDAYIAAFLCIKGFVPDLVKEDQKVVFCFKISPKLLKAVESYHGGELVSASLFAVGVKALKARIYSFKQYGKDGE